jgi:hypothetical protein
MAHNRPDQIDQKRGTSYRLPARASALAPGDSSHNGDSSHKQPVDSSLKLEEISEEELTKLKVIAAPNRPDQAYTMAPNE